MTTRLTTALLSAVALALACTTVSIAAAWAPINGARFDGRSPDTKDAGLLAHQNRHPSRRATAGRAIVRDGRSPDTGDAAVAIRSATSPVIVLAATGFDWTDAAIGAAAGFGIATIAAAAIALARSGKTFAAS